MTLLTNHSFQFKSLLKFYIKMIYYIKKRSLNQTSMKKITSFNSQTIPVLPLILHRTMKEHRKLIKTQKLSRTTINKRKEVGNNNMKQEGSAVSNTILIWVMFTLQKAENQLDLTFCSFWNTILLKD